MSPVNTVLGPVETADLGFTLSHEHVGTNAAGLRHTYDVGYTHRLMLSHDYSVPKAHYGAAVQEARRRANPDGYTFISRHVLPRLKELGASDHDIQQIMVENPRRFFEGN